MPLAALSLLAHLVAAPAPAVSIPGVAVDALYVGGGTPEIWVSATERGRRRLVRLDARDLSTRGAQAVSAAALFVDACPLPGAKGDQVVLQDAAGLTDVDGDRLLDGRALFTVPDADALYVAELCGKRGAARGELRVLVVDGVAVKGAGAARTLAVTHRARAYSGRVHRGLRPERGYDAALSLYAPRTLDVDIDGDGDLDLALVHEGRVTVFAREGAALAAAPVVSRDLAAAVGADGDADLRVRLLDLEGDRRAEAVVGVTHGAIPEKSDAFVVSGDRAPLSSSRLLWRKDGLVAPIGARGRALVVAEVDTSLVSLSGVLLTGKVPLRVKVGEGAPLALTATADVRAGRMDGAMPVVSVDFDGDGTPDLLDLGEPGRAALHLGTKDGFALDASTVWQVPAFVHVVPMPELPGVALIGAPKGSRTQLAVVRAAPRAAPPEAPREAARRGNCDAALDFDCK
ncbi:MAG: hypothetical protein HYS27_10490 [Deltaproteobacteria bacterium]|nr:hypothetical protein [Deltaproteobacteria bacterium]